MAREAALIAVIPTLGGPRATMVATLVSRCYALGLESIVSRGSGDSRADTGLAIDRALARDRPWVLYLEDDAWPCDALPAALARTCAEDTLDALQLFSRRRAHDAPGLHRARRAVVTSAVAVLLRASVLRGLSAWAPSWYARHPEHTHAADLLLQAWLREQRARSAVLSPSHVQHRCGRSTFAGRARDRQSRTYRAAFGEIPDE